MECFLVDGAVKSFADVILEQKKTGTECLVASYGFGVLQVRKVLNAFEYFLLVADISHAKLNTDAYNTVVDMSATLQNFDFSSTRNHAKLALIDDQRVIFTSANLSANRRIESYVVGDFAEFTEIDNFKKIFKNELITQNSKYFTKFNLYKVVSAKYLSGDLLNEPGCTHTIDDNGNCKRISCTG